MYEYYSLNRRETQNFVGMALLGLFTILARVNKFPYRNLKKSQERHHLRKNIFNFRVENKLKIDAIP